MPNPHTPAPAQSEAGGDAELLERAEAYARQPTSLVLDLKAQSIIRDLLAYANKQREIVEKLPVTADGVPITAGMFVWWIVVDDAEY